MLARRLPLALVALLVFTLTGTGSALAAPPAVTVTHPTGGEDVTGTVRLKVAASAGTERVDYYVNRVRVATDTTPRNGFGEDWDSRRALDGEHTVIAAASNEDGVTFSAPVTFTVDNDADTPPATPDPAASPEPADEPTPPTATTPPAVEPEPDPAPVEPDPVRPPVEEPTKPTPPPPGDRGPSGPTLVWEDDFEDGLDCTIWTRVQNDETSGAASSACNQWDPDGTPTRTTFPDDAGEAGPGDRAARFELRSGDKSARGERSELSGDGAAWRFFDGDERWLQQRIKVDPSMVQERNDRFYILTQWHAGAGSPPLVLGLEDDGALSIESNGVGTVPKTVVLAADEFPKDVWFDVSIHFVMSNDPGKGGAEVFVDGVRQTPWLAGRTMADGSSYLKLGQYRDPQPSTGVTYVDDVRLTRR